MFIAVARDQKKKNKKPLAIFSIEKWAKDPDDFL